MKKFLGILVLGLLWCNVGFAETTYIKSLAEELKKWENYRKDYKSQQIFKSCRAVASNLDGLGEWSLVYQSRSGRPDQPWLEPDVCDAIADLGKKGCQSVLLSPIGFVCDHVEVLYDLDVEAQEIAQRFNIRFYRAPTVNDHPSFLRMLADVVKRTLKEVC